MKTIKLENYTITIGEERDEQVLISIHPKFVTGKEELVMQYVSKYFADLLVKILEQ